MSAVQTLIGIDYGLKRVGIAVGNTLTCHAEPLTVIVNTGVNAVIAQIQKIAREWQATALVLGLPRHPDGTAHAMTQACLDFQVQLAQTIALPIHCVDERYTSAVLPQRARTNARGQTRAVAQDDRAAALILQQYLDQQAPAG